MSENLGKKIRLVTHDGFFHADDVYATAVLKLVYNDNVEILRSRDPQVWDSGDIVYDTSSIYDPSQNRFDHHQTEGAGVRANGVPYASFGLIWKHFAHKIIDNQKVIDLIDENLVQNVDITDTAFDMYISTKTNTNAYTLDTMVAIFYPTYKEDQSPEKVREIFLKLADLAKAHIEREIKIAKDRVEAHEKVEEIYKNTKDKRIIVLDDVYNWRKPLIEKPEPIFVVFPFKHDGRWAAQGVPKEMSGYDIRKNFPKEWGGLNNEEFQKVSGVETASFCHRALYLIGAKTKEDAIKLAELALEI